MAAKVGCKAPKFKVASTSGGEVGNEDLAGKITVLFFYPKDHTSGCTREVQAFRDAAGKFRCRGTKVVGVSRDSIKSHDKFIEKHELNFPLLSDPDKAMHEAFGVMKEKTMYGKKVMGVDRSTSCWTPPARCARSGAG
jgi:peroxiredoxin Q/BCP